MKPSRFFMIAVCFTLSYCAGPAKFEVGTASSMTKVFFDRPWQSGPADSVLISAAGGEFESFQLVIFGQHDSLRSVKCSAEGLRSDSLVISAGEITFNPVGYVRTSVVCKQYSSSLGWWPDPLLALDSFDLAPGEVQPVWVTVHVPAGTPAGIYRGTLSISTEAGGRKEIPVRLRVW
ncbi:MAG TPA: glycoside hydrolase domain-containing protein, partial [Candidatus Glassbacteria bacterium]|nr:glycoside hydrolase domain-containing protein [Candidatus Glassbacteria bacterium]